MYLDKWSEMIKDGIYTKDMTGIDHDQALEEFATGKGCNVLFRTMGFRSNYVKKS